MQPLYIRISDIALGKTYSEATLVSALQATSKPDQQMAVVRFLRGEANAQDGDTLQQLSVDIYLAQSI